MSTTAASTTFDFRHHGGFQQQFDFGPVTALNCAVFVSISEIGDIGGQVIPFQGAASCTIDNVVPGNGNFIVRGSIGWDSDIDVRLFVFTTPVPL